MGLYSSFASLLSPIDESLVTRRFSLAFVMAILAISLRALLEPILGHVAFYITVFMTEAFCATVAGMVPAIVNAVIGFAGILYFFVDPRYSLGIQPSEIHGVVGFILVSVVLIGLGVANRNKQLKLNDTILALVNEAAERRRAEEELKAAHAGLEKRVQERTVELSGALTRLKTEIATREQTEEQLRQLSLRLMTLQDEERRRIARDLHDTTGQTLSAMKMTIALLEEMARSLPGCPQLIQEMTGLTDQALKEVRTTSYLLHPPLLDEAGILSAIRWFVDGFAKRSGIEVACEIPERMERPSPHHELVLFRVLQESLTNVHRHSGATAASVRFEQETDQLRLEIADNGKGISPDRLSRMREAGSPAGVGISGMRERVRELGGYLEIRSAANGTTVSVVVPLSTGFSSNPETLSFSAL
jgi:signal transduction histidine kinase